MPLDWRWWSQDMSIHNMFPPFCSTILKPEHQHASLVLLERRWVFQPDRFRYMPRRPEEIGGGELRAQRCRKNGGFIHVTSIDVPIQTQMGPILGGGNSNIFYFHPYLGKIPILTNIFQLGWNHQLELFWLEFRPCFGGLALTKIEVSWGLSRYTYIYHIYTETLGVAKTL